MRKPVKLNAWENACDECEHSWISFDKDPPTICPECRTRTWNGKKQRGRPKTNLYLSKPTRTRLAN